MPSAVATATYTFGPPFAIAPATSAPSSVTVSAGGTAKLHIDFDAVWWIDISGGYQLLSKRTAQRRDRHIHAQFGCRRVWNYTSDSFDQDQQCVRPARIRQARMAHRSVHSGPSAGAYSPRAELCWLVSCNLAAALHPRRNDYRVRWRRRRWWRRRWRFTPNLSHHDHCHERPGSAGYVCDVERAVSRHLISSFGRAAGNRPLSPAVLLCFVENFDGAYFSVVHG